MHLSPSVQGGYADVPDSLGRWWVLAYGWYGGEWVLVQGSVGQELIERYDTAQPTLVDTHGKLRARE
jgi:hypothetical protein